MGKLYVRALRVRDLLTRSQAVINDQLLCTIECLPGGSKLRALVLLGPPGPLLLFQQRARRCSTVLCNTVGIHLSCYRVLPVLVGDKNQPLSAYIACNASKPRTGFQ